MVHPSAAPPAESATRHRSETFAARRLPPLSEHERIRWGNNSTTPPPRFRGPPRLTVSKYLSSGISSSPPNTTLMLLHAWAAANPIGAPTIRHRSSHSMAVTQSLLAPAPRE